MDTPVLSLGKHTRNGATDWHPSANMANLRRRAQLLARVRAFFHERGVLEVETPVLYGATTSEPHIASFSVATSEPGARPRRLYLQTSPEFPMKRLLAAGSGPIYQICKAFRQGEHGDLHNHEFTMLEWYRPGFDHHALMDEVEVLVRFLLGERKRSLRLSYGALFERYVGIDPFAVSIDGLRNCAHRLGVRASAELARDHRDTWLQLLLTHVIEPALAAEEMVFVYDYPVSQASLAQISDGPRPVARRFELYIQGVEIANGYQELGDADEQRYRHCSDNQLRRESGQEEVPVDERLLAALESGLPPCAGVALGFDRLAMIAAGARRIHDVISFSNGRL